MYISTKDFSSIASEFTNLRVYAQLTVN